jgi:hypothetical protein
MNSALNTLRRTGTPWDSALRLVAHSEKVVPEATASACRSRPRSGLPHRVSHRQPLSKTNILAPSFGLSDEITPPMTICDAGAAIGSPLRLLAMLVILCGCV